jgi:hypothetical protein
MCEVRFFRFVVLGSLLVLSVAVVSTAAAQPGVIGIRLASHDGWLVIESVLENMPAGRAGLRAGDRIAKVDGVPAQNMTLQDGWARVTGPVGEKITLSILRPAAGKAEEFEVTLVREALPSALTGRQRPQGPPPATPTREAQQVQWHGNKIVSRVLPYTDFVSLFVRLPVAHAAATGRDVHVAIVASAEAKGAAALLRGIAPAAQVHEYTLAPDTNEVQPLCAQLKEAGCRIVLVPDPQAWRPQPLKAFAGAVLADKLTLVVPADLSEDEDRIETINALHARGALTVGRVDRQSLVVERSSDKGKAFNRHIRAIHTDVFSTIGLDRVDARTPAITVAGVAALVLEKWPGLSGPEVRRRIIDGARSVWQMTSVETGQWMPAFTVDPITTKYTPTDEKAVFRFRALDAAGALDVDTEIPWFLNMLNCPKAWEITKGRGIVVVVTDQGFHIRHPDLVDHIKATVHFGSLSFESSEQNFHGTEMSRILLAVAPEASIIPTLCSGKGMEQLPPSIAKSFELAVQQKADVITASWAGWFNTNQELLAAVRKAADSGVVVSWFHFPEPHPGVLRSTFTYAWWEEEPRLGFADRFLTDPPGFHPVEIEAGLSGTAPQAAGLAALAKSVNPTLTPAQIEKLIFENSDPIGANVLIPDAYRLVQAARKKTPG